MNYGIFMRVNYQDALRVGHINSGLVGSCLIKDVPTDYKTEDVRTLVMMQAPQLGATAFGDTLHKFVLLPESEWPSGTFRFPFEIPFEVVFAETIQEFAGGGLIKNHVQS